MKTTIIILMGSLFLVSCSSRKRIQTKNLNNGSQKSLQAIDRSYISEIIKQRISTKMIGHISLESNINQYHMKISINHKGDEIKVDASTSSYEVDTLEGKIRLCLVRFMPLLTPTVIRTAAVRGGFFHSTSEASRSLNVDFSTLTNLKKTCRQEYLDNIETWKVYLRTLYTNNIDPTFPQKPCTLAKNQLNGCIQQFPQNDASNQLSCAPMIANLNFCEITTTRSNCTSKGMPIGSVENPVQIEKLIPFCSEAN